MLAYDNDFATMTAATKKVRTHGLQVEHYDKDKRIIYTKNYTSDKQNYLEGFTYYVGNNTFKKIYETNGDVKRLFQTFYKNKDGSITYRGRDFEKLYKDGKLMVNKKIHPKFTDLFQYFYVGEKMFFDHIIYNNNDRLTLTSVKISSDWKTVVTISYNDFFNEENIYDSSTFKLLNSKMVPTYINISEIQDEIVNSAERNVEFNVDFSALML